MKTVALYLRVSTSDQTTKNQRRELEAVAKRQGWKIVEVFEDAGISGTKGREHRPGLDAMLKGVARRNFEIVAAWSIDRLGRSLAHVVNLMNDLNEKHIGLYLHMQGVDSTTAAGAAMLGMCSVFSAFEVAVTRERIKAGLARARSEGKRLGRPPVTDEIENKIRQLRKSGMGIHRIRRELNGVGCSVVQRVVSKMRASGARGSKR